MLERRQWTRLRLYLSYLLATMMFLHRYRTNNDRNNSNIIEYHRYVDCAGSAVPFFVVP